MKNVIKKSGVTIAILFLVGILSNTAFSQNSQTCEKIVSQIYDGINQKKADHLVPVSYTHLTLPTKRIV